LPFFDAVSEINIQNFTNAADQSRSDVNTRCGLIKTKMKIEYLKEHRGEMTSIKTDALKTAKKACQKNSLRQGVDKENARKIGELILDSEFQVRSAIQDDQVRGREKKRDVRQKPMAILHTPKPGLAMQCVDARDCI